MVQKLRKKNTRAKKVRQNTTCQTKCKKICSVMRKKSKKHKDLRKMKKTKKKLLINSLAGEHVRNPFSLRLQRQCIDKLFRALGNLVESKSKVVWALDRIDYIPYGSYIPTTPEEWKALFKENKFRRPNTDVLRKDIMDKTDPYSLVSQAENEKKQILQLGERLKDTIREPNTVKSLIDSVNTIFNNNVDRNLFTITNSGEGVEVGVNLSEQAYNSEISLLYPRMQIREIHSIETRKNDIPPIKVKLDFQDEKLSERDTEVLPVLVGKLVYNVGQNNLALMESYSRLTENEKSTILQQVLCQNINKNVKIINKLTGYNEKRFVSLIPFLPSSEFEERDGNIQPADPYQRPGVNENILQSAVMAAEIEESKADDEIEESKSPEVSPLRRTSGIVAPRRLTFIEPGEEVVVEPGALVEGDDCDGFWPCMAQRMLTGEKRFPMSNMRDFDLYRVLTNISEDTLSIHGQMIMVLTSLYNNPIVYEQNPIERTESGPIRVTRNAQGIEQLLPFVPATNDEVQSYGGGMYDWVVYALDWHYYKLLLHLYKYILIGSWNDSIEREIKDKNVEIWNYLATIEGGGLGLRNALVQQVKTIADSTPISISHRVRYGEISPDNVENWRDYADREDILPGTGPERGYMNPDEGFMDQIQNVFTYLERDILPSLSVDVVDDMQTPLPRLSWVLWQNVWRGDGDSYQTWLRYCVNIEYYRLLLLIKTQYELTLVENITSDDAFDFCESLLPDIMGYYALIAYGFIGDDGETGIFGKLEWE